MAVNIFSAFSTLRAGAAAAAVLGGVFGVGVWLGWAGRGGFDIYFGVFFGIAIVKV